MSSSSSGIMLWPIAGVGMLAMLAVAVIRLICGGVGMLAVAICFSEVIGWYYRPNIHTQDSWHSHPIII